MRKTFAFLVTAAFALSLAGGASAAACKDEKGKFTKCPAPAAAAAPAKAGPCKDDKGKFTKCPATGAAANVAATAPAAAAKSSKSSMSSAADGPLCKKGKRCGNACISVNDTCHK